MARAVETFLAVLVTVTLSLLGTQVATAASCVSSMSLTTDKTNLASCHVDTSGFVTPEAGIAFLEGKTGLDIGFAGRINGAAGTVGGITLTAVDSANPTTGSWSSTADLGDIWVALKFGSFDVEFHALASVLDGDGGFWETWTPDGCDLTDPSCTPDQHALSNWSVYTVVPIPAAAWLFGTAIVCFGGLIARNRRNSQPAIRLA